MFIYKYARFIQFGDFKGIGLRARELFKYSYHL
jgi:hypothetical protein